MLESSNGEDLHLFIPLRDSSFHVVLCRMLARRSPSRVPRVRDVVGVAPVSNNGFGDRVHFASLQELQDEVVVLCEPKGLCESSNIDMGPVEILAADRQFPLEDGAEVNTFNLALQWCSLSLWADRDRRY